MNRSNGATDVRKVPLKAGIYAPILTIFKDNEDVDAAAVGKHAVRLVRDGLVGLVALGSNGEAAHLSRAERVTVISTVRSALDEAGFTDAPVIAGCSEQSTRGTVEMCHEAAQAGASCAIVLPPSYFRPAMTSDVLYSYFKDVADASPIPIMMYNFPGAAAGVDMDSDLMSRIAEHPNCEGAKFTCANTGKLTRVAAAADAITPKSNGSGFLAVGGLADITIQTVVSGGSGIIAGSANVFPKLCVRVWDLWVQGKQEEAMELQKVLSRGDYVLAKSVVPATKATLEHYFGYGGAPRRPLPRLDGTHAQAYIDGIAEAMEIEKTL